MSLPYKRMQDVFLQEDNQQLILKRNFTQSLRKLLENDIALNPESDSLPDVWKCKWYNGRYPGCGYPKGAAVWLNTEDIDVFVDSRYGEISSFAMKNPMLHQRIISIGGDLQKERKLFKSLITGSLSYAPSLEPMYYLGDVMQPIQIRVSLCSDNMALPTDDDYWKDMFDYDIYQENAERLSSLTKERISAALSVHYQNYHLDYANISDDYRSMQTLNRVVDNSVRCNLSANLESIDQQMYKSHRASKLNTKGFDYVLSVFVVKSQVDQHCIKWARLWNSGLLEQGGVTKAGVDLGDQSTGSGYLQIRLPYRYNYPKSATKRFYEIRNKYPDTPTDILQTDVLPDDNKYIIMTTIILGTDEKPYTEITSGKTGKGDYYYANEVLNIRNDSFWLKTVNQDAYYSFKTSGFIKNTTMDLLVNM